MADIAIIVVEDEKEVRDAIGRDLEPFLERFRIELTEDAEDGRAAIGELAEEGLAVGLILCDHLLPGMRGTDFLVELQQDEATASMRKVLITGQAGHEDTIRAINEASLDFYIAKPWERAELQAVVREQLTEFVIEHIENVLPYVEVLNGPRLLEAVADRRWD